ncbi:MAG: hypothetical protein V2A58_01635 [Planctomycetota bacterium]
MGKPNSNLEPAVRRVARDEAGPAGDVDLVMRGAVIEELQETIFAEAVPCL